MKFIITYANGKTEEVELSDCNTVEEALNSVAGSAPGVTAIIGPVEPAPEAA